MSGLGYFDDLMHLSIRCDRLVRAIRGHAKEAETIHRAAIAESRGRMTPPVLLAAAELAACQKIMKEAGVKP